MPGYDDLLSTLIKRLGYRRLILLFVWAEELGYTSGFNYSRFAVVIGCVHREEVFRIV